MPRNGWTSGTDIVTEKAGRRAAQRQSSRHRSPR